MGIKRHVSRVVHETWLEAREVSYCILSWDRGLVAKDSRLNNSAFDNVDRAGFSSPIVGKNITQDMRKNMHKLLSDKKLW